MNVLLIHEHGRSYGSGAVVAMYRLHRALRARGVNSTIACRRRGMEGDEFVELPRADRWENLFGALSWRLGLNDVHCVSTFKMSRFKPFLDADVVNIHGMHTNFFNYLAMPRLGRDKPLVITMHDMWHLTGHCSQSYDCQRWRTGCGRCPYPETFPPIGRDATAIEWKLKRWACGKSNATFVAPSRWLKNLAEQSHLRGQDIRQIPNPIDTEVYRPLDKRGCREELGLPHDKHIIFFVSVALDSWAKGGDLLVRALHALPPHIKSDSTLLLLGENGEAFAQKCGMDAVAMGYVHDDQRKVMMYSAADVLVQPSRAETQSLVVLESLACGTPVVGFDVGGMTELLEDGRGGVLASPENADQLSDGIVQILDDPDRRASLNQSTRALIVEGYSLQQHVERYVSLFIERAAHANGAAATILAS